MKKLLQLLSPFLVLLFFPSERFYAQPLDVNNYLPMPLPSVTTQSSTASLDHRLVRYNVATQQTDTLDFTASTESQPNKMSAGFCPDSVTTTTNAQQAYGFSGLQPADQLQGFPYYPFSTIVKIYGNFANGSSFTASGVLVGPRHVLTAGHCVISPSTGGITNCTVVPAYNLGSSPYGSAQMSYYTYYVAWAQNGDWNYDIALMELNYNIGVNTGWLGYGYNTDFSFFQNNDQKSVGYPGAFDGGNRMYAWHGTMDFQETANILDHWNQGYPGQSGSGLYATINSNRYAFGCLSHGGTINGTPYTGHTKIMPDFFNFMESVIPQTVDIAPTIPTATFQLFPNPATANALEIILPNHLENEALSLTVTDMFGKTCLQQQYNKEKTSNPNIILDIRNLIPGTYIVSLSSKHEGYRQRFVRL